MATYQFIYGQSSMKMQLISKFKQAVAVKCTYPNHDTYEYCRTRPF